jgi:hypothetical protein
VSVIESRPRRDLAAMALLLAAVLLAYANSLPGPFQYDDWWQIVDRPAVHGLAAWWHAPLGIRPLLKLSFALNWSISSAPLGFHAVNILLHVLNTLLVWCVVRHWLECLAPTLADPRRAAFITALLFALHPAATEAVTYISGRSISLMATFFLASLWAQKTSGEHGWQQALSPLLFALALATRETAAILPLALLWLALCSGQGWRTALNSIYPHIVVLIVAVIIAIAIPGYRHFFAASVGARAPFEQWLGQTTAHAYLVLHPLLGLDVNIDPDLTIPAGINAAALATWTALIAVAALAWWGRRRWPWLGFGVGWYLLQLLPSNSFLPRLDLANDRHLYLAMIGPALIAGMAIAKLRSTRVQAVLVIALATTLSVATIRRNEDYRSELALWSATARSSPGKARPWVNLGYARQATGDPAGAAAAYRCALAKSPGDVQASNNLALLPEPSSRARLLADDCRLPSRD